MPGIWSINSLYNNNIKKVSSKLTFEVGERFSARVVNRDESKKEISLKLLDGWQFPATLEEPLEVPIDGILRFQIEGYENGKLKIKLIKSNEKETDSKESSLESILEETGMDKKDINILEKMVKHGMPLTKENISKMKTILDFKEKILSNPEEEDQFIDIYLQSKNIDKNSEEAKNIRSELKKFFSTLKNTNEDDIFTLVENNIEVNKENIESFNKVFKDSLGLYNKLKKVKELIDTAVYESKTEKEKVELEVIPKDIENEANKDKIEKVINRGEIELEDIEKLFKDIVKQNLKMDVSLQEKLLNNLKDILNKTDEKTLLNLIKAQLEKGTEIDDILKDLLQGNLTNEKSDILKDIVRVSQDVFLDTKDKIKDSVRSLLQDLILTDNEISEIAKSIEIATESEGIKTLKENINLLSNRIDSVTNFNSEVEKYKSYDNMISNKKAGSVVELLKTLAKDADVIKYIADDIISDKKFNFNMEEFNGIMRKLNTISDEDILKEIKTEVFNRTGNSDIINNITKEDINKAFKSLLGKNLDITSKEAERIISSIKAFVKQESINSNIEQLNNQIKQSSSKLEPKVNEQGILNKTSQELVKEQLHAKVNLLKDLLSDILGDNLESKPEIYEKALAFIKNNINDMKVFNTVSNQYYYLDLPLNMNNNEYPCKLIIKDERNKGKKIDSQNVKLVVNVNTINLGMVDAYIKVKNRQMDIEMNCEEKWMKALEAGKSKLMEALYTLGYDISVAVKERKVEVDITNCREFFNDNDISTVDIKV
ncbi:hypothetical protein [Desnuesiella massiliensis]|uniref:hypothetical protein n=1 Tax=Desnuesiella massiliensis TaxID=1650662 RepID=UPI0006E26A1A|nr:hypothetical protein [Desnuesiella massiliensis]